MGESTLSFKVSLFSRQTVSDVKTTLFFHGLFRTCIQIQKTGKTQQFELIEGRIAGLNASLTN